MKKMLIFLFIALVSFSCSAALHPVQSEGVILDQKENMLISEKENYRLEVKIAPQSYAFYGMEDTFIIFFVKVENRGDKEIETSTNDFVILDDKMNQVNVMAVKDVAKIIEQNLFYLIPYPYIGYYSEGQNYYEGRYLYNPGAPHTYPVSPKDLYLDAFPYGKILPKANISGKIYFKKRLSEAKKINLKAIRTGSDYLFNFMFEVK
ncbi:MAG: lipoprotein [bacterium]